MKTNLSTLDHSLETTIKKNIRNPNLRVQIEAQSRPELVDLGLGP